jgi:hypothetical protein
MDLEANTVEQRSYPGFFAWSFLLRFAGFTSFAGTIMEEFWAGRKVGCHRDGLWISFSVAT